MFGFFSMFDMGKYILYIYNSMSEKYKGKYRNDSTRLKNWDYGWNAPYFVTICTQNREHFFGKIMDGKMVLSKIGHSANLCWNEIPNHFPFVELGAHIIMPNHVHGIIIINKFNDGRDEGTQNFASLHSTGHSSIDKPKNQFGPQSKNLASIIRGFKIGVTKNARLVNPNFSWQPRF
ncbi:MAG TPA: hypothetical protein VFD80_07190, partial [Flavobacteriaceae bacterium]|nr:hypothetical protein [Flavobacteriaceae bacterium]